MQGARIQARARALSLMRFIALIGATLIPTATQGEIEVHALL